MASHLNPQQVNTQKDINKFLSSINSSQVASLPSAGSPRAFVTRIQIATIRLENLGKIAEDRRLTTAEETERQSLYDNIKKIDAALGALDPADQIGLLSPSPTSTAEQDQRSAVLRENLKKQAEAADAEQAATARQQEFEEQDLSDPAAIQVIRSAYQHYLLYNTDFFAEYHKQLLNVGSTSLVGYKIPSIPGNIIQTDGYIKRKSPDQPRIFLLSGDEDSSIVNNKLSLCPGNERFTNLTTAEYASLQPLLRIYKVYRNKDGTDDKKVELEFRNKTGLEGIDGLIDIPQPAGAALAGHTRGVECGVKSFDWSFIGSDPFTATRDIEATLVLHAQHFSALSVGRQGVDVLNPGSSPVLEDYKYLDLIIQPDCSKKASPTNPQPYNGIYNPGCYEIQIDVGYAPQSGDLREAICCQYDSLYLVHVDHKFNFNEDGTLELSISYRGRLETIMNDKKFNVLLPGGGFSTIERQGLPGSRVPGTGQLIYTYNYLESELTTARTTLPPPKSRIKELERLRAALIFYLRQYTYALILETMEDKGMIHSISLSNDHFLRFARWKEPIFAGTLPDKLQLSNLAAATSGTNPALQSGEENSVAVQLVAADTGAVKDPETDAVAAALDNLTNLAEAQLASRLQEAVKLKTHKINYIYLGDLLATVLSNTIGDLELPQNINSKTANTGVLLIFGKIIGDRLAVNNPFSGPSQTTQDITGTTVTDVSSKITDPIVDNFQLVLGNIEISDQNGNSKQINLAHIPISLESFQDFMMKNVISQNSDYYSLIDFIDALISDLVTDMFSAEHHVGLTEADSRLSVSLFTSKTPLRDSGIFEQITGGANIYKEINTKKIDSNNLPFGKDSKCVDRQNDPYQYLVINTLNSFPSNLAGVYEVTSGNSVRGDSVGDKRRGILHFTYGRDRGLLKSVQFSKTDQEYLPEARFAGGDGSLLNQLSNVYDASFNMIGNNIFRPGMLIYFDPEPIGVGQPWQYRSGTNGVVVGRSWANIMGIGGYHLITEVAHSIGPGKFDTTIKARWVNSGEDKSDYTDQELAAILGIP
jgi:hypothetical protein